MCYVVLQAPFWAMENDIMILLNLLINQEETLSENAKKESGTQVWNAFSDILSLLKHKIISGIDFVHSAVEVFHFNRRYWQI